MTLAPFFLVSALFVAFLLVFVPAKVEIMLRNSKVNLTIYFFVFRLELNNKKKKASNEKINKKKNISNFFEQINQTLEKLKIITPFLVFLLKNIRSDEMILQIRISSEDAKKCATGYSNIYSFCAIIFSILKSRKKKIKNLNFTISPDFISYGTYYFGKFCINISMAEIIHFSFFYFLSYFGRKMRCGD